MRRQIPRVLLIAVGAIALAFGIMRLAADVSVENVLEVASLRDEALPDLLQRIRDFHRVVTRNGQKLLEVSADEASYFRDTAAIAIVRPTLTFFDDGEEVGEIVGARARLILDGSQVVSVALEGAVRLAFVGFEIQADEVFYDRAGKLITAFGPATLSSSEFEVHGTGLEVDLGAETLRVASKVVMIVHRGSRSSHRTGTRGAS